MGLFRRKDSQFWWMSKTVRGFQIPKSTGTSDRAIAESRYREWASIDELPDRTERHTGTDAGIYLLWAAHSKLLKIGSSIHLTRRLKHLESVIPEPTVVLCVAKTGNVHVRELEATIHRTFADRRVKGEWFSFRVEDVPAVFDSIVDFIQVCSKRGYVTSEMERSNCDIHRPKLAESVHFGHTVTGFEND